MVIEALILIYYKQSLKIIVETNFFDYISSRIFFQLGEDGRLHLIAFFLKNIDFAKCNYEIDNKKLLAIIQYFK